MILVSEIQLGLKDQTLYLIDDEGNKKSVARIEISNLPETICGFYYGYNATQVHLRGPKEMCKQVAEESKEIASTVYADKGPINIII